MSKEHNKLVDDIIKYLEYQRALVTDTDASKWGRGSGSRAKVKKGWTDITACLPPYGKFCVIEVKVGRDKLDDDQITMREQTIAKGGIHIEARCLDDVIKVITAYYKLIKITTLVELETIGQKQIQLELELSQKKSL